VVIKYSRLMAIHALLVLQIFCVFICVQH